VREVQPAATRPAVLDQQVEGRESSHAVSL
jgi:hypothetical protein